MAQPLNIKRILVPVDFSRYDRNALVYAAGLAKPYGATITVVHVVEPLSAYAGQMYWGLTIDAANQREEMLRATVPADVDVPCVTVMLQAKTVGMTTNADIAAEIVRYANETESDTIVMSSHGRRGIASVLIGGVAEDVMRLAECPVVVVKSPPAEFHHQSENQD